MYSQANVREESVLRLPARALPSVIVDTEKVLREADGPTKRADPRIAMRGGWKGVRPGVRLKNRTVRGGRSPKNTSGTQRQRQISKDIVDNYRTMFESRISAGEIREITIPSKSSYFFLVL